MAFLYHRQGAFAKAAAPGFALPVSRFFYDVVKWWPLALCENRELLALPRVAPPSLRSAAFDPAA